MDESSGVKKMTFNICSTSNCVYSYCIPVSNLWLNFAELTDLLITTPWTQGKASAGRQNNLDPVLRIATLEYMAILAACIDK